MRARPDRGHAPFESFRAVGMLILGGESVNQHQPESIGRNMAIALKVQRLALEGLIDARSGRVALAGSIVHHLIHDALDVGPACGPEGGAE